MDRAFYETELGKELLKQQQEQQMSPEQMSSRKIIQNLREKTGELTQQVSKYSEELDRSQQMIGFFRREGLDPSLISADIERSSSKLGEKFANIEQLKTQQSLNRFNLIMSKNPSFFRNLFRRENPSKYMRIIYNYLKNDLGITIKKDDVEKIIKIAKLTYSKDPRDKKTLERIKQFAQQGNSKQPPDDYAKYHPNKMLLHFLENIQSTPRSFQYPILQLEDASQIRPDIPSVTELYDSPESVPPLEEQVLNREQLYEMMSEPDHVIGQISINTIYPTIEDFITSALRNEYFTYPVIQKEHEDQDGTIPRTGHIGVKINPTIEDAVNRFEAIFAGNTVATPITDVADLPIYFTVASVLDSNETLPMKEYIKGTITDTIISAINSLKISENDQVQWLIRNAGLDLDHLKNLNQQAAAGRHSAILILHQRKLYSIGYSSLGGKVERSGSLINMLNNILHAKKGLIATRDYYIDTDPDNINLQISDIGILRRNHLDNLLKYSVDIGYVSLGGIVYDSPDGKIYGHIEELAETNSVDEIAQDEVVQSYYENGLLTNYGTQFFLPKDAYVFQTTQLTVLSDIVSLFSKKYGEMLSRYGTNCARFIQHIFNDRIQCGVATLAVPAKCERLDSLPLPKVDGDYILQFIDLYMANDVAALVDFCRPNSNSYGGNKLKLRKKTHRKRQNKKNNLRKSRKHQRKSRKLRK
jgi:hypothetical protein